MEGRLPDIASSTLDGRSTPLLGPQGFVISSCTPQIILFPVYERHVCLVRQLLRRPDRQNARRGECAAGR